MRVESQYSPHHLQDDRLQPGRGRAFEHHVLEDLRLVALDGELAGLRLVAALHLVFDRERGGRQWMEANVFRLDRVLVDTAGTWLADLIGDHNVDGELLGRRHRRRRRRRWRTCGGGRRWFRVVTEDQRGRNADTADEHRDDRERGEQLAGGLHRVPRLVRTDGFRRWFRPG